MQIGPALLQIPAEISPASLSPCYKVCRAALNISSLQNTDWLVEVVYTHYSVYSVCVNICLIARSLYSNT